MVALRAPLLLVPRTESARLSPGAEPFFPVTSSFTRGDLGPSSWRLTVRLRFVVVQSGPPGSGLLSASQILGTPGEAWLPRGRCRPGMLGAQRPRIPEARPSGFRVQAQPPKQSWVPKPVLDKGPFRVLRRDGTSRFPGVRGRVVEGREGRLGELAVQPAAGQAARGSGRLRGDGGGVCRAPLQHRLQLQDLGRVVPVVPVTRLDDGAALLGVLDQVVPVLVLLETEEGETITRPEYSEAWEVRVSALILSSNKCTSRKESRESIKEKVSSNTGSRSHVIRKGRRSPPGTKNVHHLTTWLSVRALDGADTGQLCHPRKFPRTLDLESRLSLERLTLWSRKAWFQRALTFGGVCDYSRKSRTAFTQFPKASQTPKG